MTLSSHHPLERSGLKFWQVDSFAAAPFRGNPAAVFVYEGPLPDDFMKNIAIEMNLSETAFIQIRPGQNPLLRWFMPMAEIDLCGHATLAAAHIMMTEIQPSLNDITFDTKFVGPLHVQKDNWAYRQIYRQVYRMDFPSRLGERQDISDVPEFVITAINPDHRPHTAYKSRDLMLVYKDETIIQEAQPDFHALKNYPDFIIITAQSQNPEYDFISRFFCADDAVTEDPVTGSAHSTLAPYWADQLGKTKLRAYQASKRGGDLGIEISNNRIFISGQALTIFSGVFYPDVPT